MATGEMTAAAFLVAELRRARIRRGWSQEELAKAINYSPSMVSAVELGQAPPTSKYLEQFDKALDTGGLFTRMLANLVSLDRAQPWLRGGGEIVSQAQAQAQARVLRWFEPLYVPGLLQTEAYARAVFEAGGLLEAAEVEARLNERMEGQRILYDEEQPRLVAVVDEAALRRQVGTRKTMYDQTAHLARVATEHPRVRLHVVPLSGQEYPGMGGPFILATLREETELAFLATQVGGQEVDQPSDLGRLQRVWEASLGEALPPRKSIELVRKVTESWT